MDPNPAKGRFIESLTDTFADWALHPRGGPLSEGCVWARPNDTPRAPYGLHGQTVAARNIAKYKIIAPTIDIATDPYKLLYTRNTCTYLLDGHDVNGMTIAQLAKVVKDSCAALQGRYKVIKRFVPLDWCHKYAQGPPDPNDNMSEHNHLTRLIKALECVPKDSTHFDQNPKSKQAFEHFKNVVQVILRNNYGPTITEDTLVLHGRKQYGFMREVQQGDAVVSYGVQLGTVASVDYAIGRVVVAIDGKEQLDGLRFGPEPKIKYEKLTQVTFVTMYSKDTITADLGPNLEYLGDGTYQAVRAINRGDSLTSFAFHPAGDPFKPLSKLAVAPVSDIGDGLFVLIDQPKSRRRRAPPEAYYTETIKPAAQTIKTIKNDSSDPRQVISENTIDYEIQSKDAVTYNLFDSGGGKTVVFCENDSENKYVGAGQTSFTPADNGLARHPMQTAPPDLSNYNKVFKSLLTTEDAQETFGGGIFELRYPYQQAGTINASPTKQPRVDDATDERCEISNYTLVGEFTTEANDPGRLSKIKEADGVEGLFNGKPNIQVRKSTLEAAGLGAFAARDIAKNDIIAPYFGLNVTKDADAQWDDNGYIRHRNATEGVDGRGSITLAQYCNDPRLSVPLGTSRKEAELKLNAKFSKVTSSKWPVIKATRDIEQGQEIFLNYGDAEAFLPAAKPVMATTLQAAIRSGNLIVLDFIDIPKIREYIRKLPDGKCYDALSNVEDLSTERDELDAKVSAIKSKRADGGLVDRPPFKWAIVIDAISEKQLNTAFEPLIKAVTQRMKTAQALKKLRNKAYKPAELKHNDWQLFCTPPTDKPDDQPIHTDGGDSEDCDLWTLIVPLNKNPKDLTGGTLFSNDGKAVGKDAPILFNGGILHKGLHEKKTARWFLITSFGLEPSVDDDDGGAADDAAYTP